MNWASPASLSSNVGAAPVPSDERRGRQIRRHARREQAMAAFCKDDRLMGVAYVPLDNQRARWKKRRKRSTSAARRSGCRPHRGGQIRRPPDLDPFWQLLADKGVPFVLHIGAGSRVLPRNTPTTARPSPDLHGGAKICASRTMSCCRTRRRCSSPRSSMTACSIASPI